MYLNIFSDILKNMEEDLKSFIKLPLFKKELLNSSDLEILPARYTVQYVMEEMFIYFEKRLNQIGDEEPIVYFFKYFLSILFFRTNF